jgi:23S rRNA pseudouridine955/2504/2580 synthase
MTIYEDADVMVLNKPAGLAVQGGSGMTRHVDMMLEVMRDAKGQKPRLVHRLDRKRRAASSSPNALCGATKAHRCVPRTLGAKNLLGAGCRRAEAEAGPDLDLSRPEEADEDTIMRVAKHGDEGASHAVTYYAVVETSAQKLAWVSLKPVTGVRISCARIWRISATPIVGDPKYFNIENWQLPGGIQKRCICWRAAS